MITIRESCGNTRLSWSSVQCLLSDLSVHRCTGVQVVCTVTVLYCTVQIESEMLGSSAGPWTIIISVLLGLVTTTTQWFMKITNWENFCH